MWWVLLVVILAKMSGYQGYRETGLVLAAQKFESKTGSEIAVAQEIVGKCGLMN
jgi:hypothetical protein